MRITGNLLIVLGVLVFPINILMTGVTRKSLSMPEMLVIAVAIWILGFVVLIFDSRRSQLSEKRKIDLNGNFPCPVCHKTEFTWGSMPFSTFKKGVGSGDFVYSRRCNNCGNVQQFTKTD